MLVSLDEHDRIIGIDGDPDNPATAGHVCLKGLSYARRVTSPDRILTPPPPDGKRVRSRYVGASPRRDRRQASGGA
jgi:anaerobic selenocysteine-containing dehydrogenase